MRRPIGAVAILSGLMVLLLAAQYAGDIAAGRLDRWAQAAVIAWWPDAGYGALVIDYVGQPAGVVVGTGLLAAICLTLGRWRLAVVVVVGLGVTGVVTLGLKPVVGRTIHDGFLAYPSGHTATATVFALVVMLLVVDLHGTGTRFGLLLILSGACVGGATMALSQITLGAHYPTDTVGGFCVAMVVVPATAYLIDRGTGYLT